MGKKGLFVGLCGLDIAFYGQNGFPMEDTKTKCDRVGSEIGGPAANAAITFSLLGGEATVLSYIGNSPIGRVVHSLMAEYGVRVIDLCDDEDIKCVSAIYVDTKNATRTIFSGRNKAVQLKDIPMAENAIQEADFVLYDGHFHEIDGLLLKTIKASSKDLIFDGGGYQQTYDEVLRHNPILICSEGFQKDGKDGMALKKVFSIDRVAVTHGKGPIIYRDVEEGGTLTPPQVNAVDTLGAGDVLHGAFCYYYEVRGLPFASALEEAMRIASKSTEVLGVVEGVHHAIKTSR